MKRTALALTIIFALLVSSMVGVTTVHFGTAQNGTNISEGIITSNTTWVQANSPYTLTGNVLVSNGVTLRIEAGVTVNLSSYSLTVNGTLQAIGNSSSIITLNSGEIDFTPYSTNWAESTGTGCIIQNAIVSSALSLEDSTMINNNTITGGISIGNQLEVAIGEPTISNNTITGQGVTLNWEGTANADILNNIISDCSGAGIDASVPVENSIAYNLIEGNLIINNTNGIEIWVNGPNPNYSDIIENNTIANNSVGISLNENWYPNPLLATIEYNNIYANTGYNVNMGGDLGIPDNVNTTFNWWGTTNTQAISQTLYDYYDNYNLGKVLFSPFLTSPNMEVPTYIIASAGDGGSISPSGVVSVNYGSSQTFTITPNTGYHITEVYVNGTSIGVVSSYKVQDIQGATTISATFAINTPETWNVESGTYVNGVHNWNAYTTFSDNGTIQIDEPQGQWYILYTSVPQGDFSASLNVNSQSLNGFALELRSDLPFAGSTNGVNFEFDSRDNGSFLLAREVNTTSSEYNQNGAGGWIWNEYTSPIIQQNVWFTMKLIVQSNPYNVTALVYDVNGNLLWSYSATDMSSPQFNQLQYIGFGATENGGNYTVNNVSIASQPVATPTPTPTPTQTNPSITLDPDIGQAGTGVVAELSGFPTDVTIIIGFGTTRVGTLMSATGNGSVQFSVPQVSPGTYNVTANGTPGGRATTFFFVGQSTTPSPTPTPTATPTPTPAPTQSPSPSPIPTPTTIATITVGTAPYGVAYDSGKGEIFVTNLGADSVSVISDSTNAVVATVTVGNYPDSVAYDSGKGEILRSQSVF